MKAKFLVPTLLAILSTQSFAASRIRCPEVSDIVPEGATIESYKSFFTENKIVPKTELTLNFVEQFKNEFEKFPVNLRQELIEAGNKIHIMEGSGVTVDPTWNSAHQTTFDGRPWSEVPGGGGSTAWGYLKSPTRIVINHLYDHHGSADMFLHKHGHSLDSIRKLHGLSSSDIWSKLLSSESGSTKFLSDICGSYCTSNIEEGFAELFANYHGCEESREQMEREVPIIAEFFSKFISTKKFDKIIDTAPADSRKEKVRRRLRGILGRIIPNDDE